MVCVLATERGWSLDPTLLAHLVDTSHSRTARFQLRGLVMRDSETAQQARHAETASDAEGVVSESVGLRWLRTNALNYPDKREVARDALQFAADSAWFVLRVLTSREQAGAAGVREMLGRFAAERDLAEELVGRWGLSAE
jgi:hypothetical protein